MKKQIFTFLMVLTLATVGVVLAQGGGSSPTPSTLPPSQQVDQSGQPETGPGPDVDVDAGQNAEDGLVDVEVNSNTDSDTAAQGNDTQGTMGTTGTQQPRTNLNNETETGTGPDVDVDTGANASGAVDVDVNSRTDADTDASGVDETGSLGDSDNLPSTGSELPLVGLIGLLSLGAALVLRKL